MSTSKELAIPEKSPLQLMLESRRNVRRALVVFREAVKMQDSWCLDAHETEKELNKTLTWMEQAIEAERSRNGIATK